MPGVGRYFSVFWGYILMLLKLFGYLSDERTPLVDVLRPILVYKIEAFGEVLSNNFVPSLILFLKNDTPNPREAP